MKYSIKKLFIILVSMTTIISMFANDSRTYPGAMGYAMYGASSRVYKTSGTLQNNDSTNSLFVGLPVVHDATEDEVDHAYIGVIDQHPTQNIKGRLWIKQTNIWWSSPSDSSRGHSYSDQLLHFGDVIETSEWGGGRRQYYFQVSLPPKYNGKASKIYNYHIKEGTGLF